jgi:hypothetical protein
MEQQLVNFIFGLVMVLLGIIGTGIAWWVNTIWSMVKTQQAEINMLHIKLAENYMPRAELQDTLARIFDKLDEIQRDVREGK